MRAASLLVAVVGMIAAAVCAALVCGCGGGGNGPAADARPGDGPDGGAPSTDPEAMARGCALAVSCGGPLSTLPPNTCYESVASTLMQGRIADPLRCADATDCTS